MNNKIIIIKIMKNFIYSNHFKMMMILHNKTKKFQLKIDWIELHILHNEKQKKNSNIWMDERKKKDCNTTIGNFQWLKMNLISGPNHLILFLTTMKRFSSFLFFCFIFVDYDWIGDVQNETIIQWVDANLWPLLYLNHTIGSVCFFLILFHHKKFLNVFFFI